MLLSVLTPLWIPLDAWVFPPVVWHSLALQRIAVSFAFALTAFYSGRAATLKRAYAALAALFSIPSVFFLLSHVVLQGAALTRIGALMASGYAFLPFVLLAGLAIFPLTMRETVTFGALLLGVAAAPLAEQGAFMVPVFNAVAVLWLLALVAVVASLSAVSQLEFLRTLLADIEEIKKHEAALRESEERYALAMEGTSEGLWQWDLTRNQAYLAPRLATMVGIPSPTAEHDPTEIRNSYEQRVHPEDRLGLRQAYGDYLKGRTAFYSCEYRLRCADGSYRWVLDRGLGKRDGNDRVYRMAGSVSDITERKNHEVELRHAMQQAELASRAKTEFLANISHELRTPLNAIIGFSDIIRQEILGSAGNQKYREYAEDIYQSGSHLLEVINDILDVAKIEAGREELHEEALDVGQCIEAALRLVHQRAAAKGLSLESALLKDLPLLRGDERKIKQILINLLSNSVKFTPPGGRVTITADLTSTGGMRLAIRDTGIGIAEGDIPKALSPFGQVESYLNRKHQGTGLGLSLVQALAELHRASFELASQPGQGTTVTLEFPAARVMPHPARHRLQNEPEANLRVVMH